MRILICAALAGLATALLLSLQVLAHAAGDGHQATITMTYKLDMSGIQMPDAKSPARQGSKTPATPSLSQTLSGVMYWTSTNSRVEMDMTGNGILVSLCDWEKREIYSLDLKAKTARKIDLSHDIPGLSSQLSNSMPYGMDWDKTVESIKDVPGATLKEAGRSTVNGMRCTVYDYSLDMSKTLQPSATIPKGSAQQDPAMAKIHKNLGIAKGKIWASKELNTAVKMELTMAGMNMTWSLDNIKHWDVDKSMFVIPTDFKIITSQPISSSKKPNKLQNNSHGKH